jgi:hypothetical protein
VGPTVYQFHFQNGAASSVLKKLNLRVVETSVCAEQVGQNIQADQLCAAGTQANNNACFVSSKVTTGAGFYNYSL